MLADISRFRALALGPGLGSDPAVRQAVFALVAEARVPLVLDADGLNALNGDLEPLRARQTLGAPTVLTPHDGEYRAPRGPAGRATTGSRRRGGSPIGAAPSCC